jgi:CoA:oxalate CoA-transferase
MPGSMKRLGLDHPKLRRHTPRLVYAAISGFGQTGPYAHRPALDIIVQAMGGIMSITGEPGGPPVRPGASLGDIAAGIFAAIAILAALQERARSGKGQMIDLSMLDCQIAIQENAFARYFANGQVPRALGTRHPVFTPFQAFQTKDGYVVVAIVGGANDQWPLFCATIGHLELMDDPRFLDGGLRTRHYHVLEPILNKAMKRKPTAEWIEEFSQVGIPCGPVNTIDQVARDPQALHRGMFKELSYPKLGRLKLVNTPVRMSRSKPEVNALAPALGEHTHEVLTKLLRIPASEVRELQRERVI